MELSKYTEKLREQLASASALADEETQQVVQKLSTSLDSALRLSLIQALSDAAVEINAELAPTTVEVRMDGAEPEFVVRQAPPSDHDESYSEDADDDDDFASDDEEGQARISLRLSTLLKQRVDDAADEDQVSTNAWLTEAVVSQLRRRRRRSDYRGHGSHRRGRHGGTWNDVFGPDGPFGPHGPFGPNGPFAPGQPCPPDPPHAGGRGGQRYTGWV